MFKNCLLKRHSNNVLGYNNPTGVTKARKSTTVMQNFQKENDTGMREPIKMKIKRTAKRIKSLQTSWTSLKDTISKTWCQYTSLIKKGLINS